MRVGGLSKSGPLREIYTGQENNNDTIGIVYNIFPTYILVTFLTVTWDLAIRWQILHCHELVLNSATPVTYSYDLMFDYE